MTAVCTDQLTWPQLKPFGPPIPTGCPLRYFVVAVFVSVVIHAFLAFLLWGVVTDRTATAPSIGTPLIVSLVSLSTPAAGPHDGRGREAVSAVPATDPPAQRSRSAEHKAETETVVASKAQGGPGAEAPVGESPATDAPPSIDLEDAYRIAREIGRMLSSEAETAAASRGQGASGSGSPDGKSLAAGAPPTIDLEVAYSTAREVGNEWASRLELTAQSPRFTSRALYLKNHLDIIRVPRPDCRTAYAERGLLAIPSLLKDTITRSGCEWGQLRDEWRMEWRAVHWESPGEQDLGGKAGPRNSKRVRPTFLDNK